MPFGMTTEEATRYQRIRRLNEKHGKPYTFRALGMIRRIQALHAIGYSQAHIARESDGLLTKDTIRSVREQDPNSFVMRKTAHGIVLVYKKLHMKPTDEGYALRVKRYAKKMGWGPPLSWDDIDSPTEKPSGFKVCRECQHEAMPTRDICYYHHRIAKGAA